MIKNRKEQSNSDGACAACYCGAYMPIDGAYYSDAAMYDAGKFNCEIFRESKLTTNNPESGSEFQNRNSVVFRIA